MSLWDSVKSMTAVASAAAMEVGKKAKLKTDILWADHELQVRQRRFGIELYDHVAPMSSQVDFWQGGCMDEQLMDAIRPALLETQREIAVLELRRVQQKERLARRKFHGMRRFRKRQKRLEKRYLMRGWPLDMPGIRRN
ncbi:hypothetical protein MHU86_20403 [Fragilaria crotonensis]|nr:hypothetical protein MHU86_20403 [Fragilaria crotonensis]